MGWGGVGWGGVGWVMASYEEQCGKWSSSSLLVGLGGVLVEVAPRLLRDFECSTRAQPLAELGLLATVGALDATSGRGDAVEAWGATEAPRPHDMHTWEPSPPGSNGASTERGRLNV